MSGRVRRDSIRSCRATEGHSVISVTGGSILFATIDLSQIESKQKRMQPQRTHNKEENNESDVCASLSTAHILDAMTPPSVTVLIRGVR